MDDKAINEIQLSKAGNKYKFLILNFFSIVPDIAHVNALNSGRKDRILFI
tara:strand:+ start:1363 stop:1512 length:150 start_codon:yes stop_codon:yes gene_type:complete